MKVVSSIRKAIDAWGGQRTSRGYAVCVLCGRWNGEKVYTKLGSYVHFTQLLRDNYAILGPRGFPGINIVGSHSPIKVQRPKAPGGKPDLAHIIYGIHRCSHGYGDELQSGFALILDARGEAGHATD